MKLVLDLVCDIVERQLHQHKSAMFRKFPTDLPEVDPVDIEHVLWLKSRARYGRFDLAGEGSCPLESGSAGWATRRPKKRAESPKALLRESLTT